MARNFVTQIVREHDGERHLTAAGFVWNEPRPLMFKVGIPIFGLSTFAATGLVVGNDTIGGIGLGIAIVILVVCIYAGRRDACVVFERDGRIATPHGFPGYRHHRFVAGEHKYIRSIERVNFGGMWWYVQMSSASGNIVTFAQTLDMNEAFKITVQLNAAIIDMRADLLVAAPVSQKANLIG